MKFKLKRGLAAFLVLLMTVCVLLSGCEEKNNNDDFKEEFPPRQTQSAVTEKPNKVTQKQTEKEDPDADDEEDKTTASATQKPSDETEKLTDSESAEKVTDADESKENNTTDNQTDGNDSDTESSDSAETEQDFSADPEGIPPYSDSPFFALNGNNPEFTEEEITTKSYEFYSELDSLGRCGYTVACIGKDLMPTEDRESISSVKPSGWVNNAYDSSLVDGRYIYNRCHLIGFQLTGENANKQNLITGTRYMNVDGMLPFENMVADYVKETNNHVMYRVTPIYVGDNLVASGVQMEAFSVEDNGEGICFNVYVYNVQPGITINYATGDNWLTGGKLPETEPPTEAWDGKYILNVKSKKIHKSTCSGAQDINAENRKDYEGSLDELIADGYDGCGICKPIKK